jgi:CheY-like chemotaxis protein
MAGIVKIPELSVIPTMMVTASGSQENRDAAYQVNPNLAGYIVKPYKTEDFLAAIKPFLR